MRGLASCVFGAVVGLLACERRRDPPPPPVAAEEVLPLEWTTVSASGHATVTARREGSTCEVSCEREHARVWSRSQCLAKAVDHRFVSEDCSTFVALMDAPFVDQGALSRTPVGTVIGATGEPIVLRLGALSDLKRVKVSQSGKWVAWLQGTVELSGEKPRALADGTGIAFETLDGVRHSLSFVELARWSDASRPSALYQWLDADGSTRITPFEQIPPRALAKATLVAAEVSEIKGAPRPLPAPLRGQPSEPDLFPRCATFSNKVAQLEKSLASLPQPTLQGCSGMIQNKSGPQFWIEYRKCMFENEAAIKTREERVAALNAELEVARDELRKVQSSGCR